MGGHYVYVKVSLEASTFDQSFDQNYVYSEKKHN